MTRLRKTEEAPRSSACRGRFFLFSLAIFVLRISAKIKYPWREVTFAESLLFGRDPTPKQRGSCRAARKKSE